jgi:hypothetical protein
MTLPANIRVNVGAPFPALVKSSAGLSVQKANGIWTLGLGYPQLAVQGQPVPTNLATDFVAVFDSVAQNYFLLPLSQMAIGGGRLQRAVTVLPVTFASNDQILHLNFTGLAGPISITLPPFGSRAGIPLTFKDVGLTAATVNITLAATAGEFIDGVFTSVVLNQNGQAIMLTPANDGVNAGWWRE